jgi:hypothetical protein
VPAATGTAAARAALDKAADPADDSPAPDLMAALTVPADPRDGPGAAGPRRAEAAWRMTA